MAWVALWRAFHQTRKYSFLMISQKLLDFSHFFLLIFSPLGTADILLFFELSGDGYSLLCSKKQPPRHNSFIPGHVTVQHYSRPFQVLIPTVLPYSFSRPFVCCLWVIHCRQNNYHFFAVVWLTPVRKGPLGKPPVLPSTSTLSRGSSSTQSHPSTLSELQRRYTQYECGLMQPLL